MEAVKDSIFKFHLKGLDCPHCSAMIETETGELDGVLSSNVNLMNQMLTIKVERDIPDLSDRIESIVHSHEPDVEVLEAGINRTTVKPAFSSAENEKESFAGRITMLCAGGAMFAAGLIMEYLLHFDSVIALAVLIAAYLTLGSSVLIKAFKNILNGQIFDENFLMSVSTIAAFCIGEAPEAVAVMLFYQIGELFQDMAVDHSRRSIKALMDLSPETMVVIRNGEEIEVPSEDVSAGEVFVVRPGERTALDGIVEEGNSTLDTAALTGESAPISVKAGDTVLSGCINQSGILRIRAEKEFQDSTVARIIDMVENAAARKAQTENFITRFARYYTPVVTALALLLAVVPPIVTGGDWTEWIRRGCVFLIISCPCALVISIPLTFFGGIGAASRRGVLVKGSNYLEALAHADTVVFDKTGTLTKGSFRVERIIPANGFSEKDVLRLAALAESYSNHPAARSITKAYEAGGVCETDAANAADSYIARHSIDKKEILNVNEIMGKGVSVLTGSRKISAGNASLMELENVNFEKSDIPGTKIYVSVDGTYAGVIIITDEIKDDSIAAVSGLRALGINRTVMLTGDDEKIAASVARRLGIDEYFAELLPADKVEIMDKIENMKSFREQGKKAVFVGDGINDAPVLARADVGAAMGGMGSDAAIEAADVVLMTDEPSKLIDAVIVAKMTQKIVIQNLVMSLGIKFAFLIMGALGLANMWMAVFGDVGVTMIAVVNAMRMLRA